MAGRVAVAAQGLCDDRRLGRAGWSGGASGFAQVSRHGRDVVGQVARGSRSSFWAGAGRALRARGVV